MAARIFEDNSRSIGNTPLVRLRHVISGDRVRVLAKIEGRNPAYSVKCRVGAGMIWDAEKRGLLVPGRELVEPTSGNTGIALAFVAADRGYPLNLVMPESMSLERRKILKVFGTNLILTPASKGMRGAVEKARQMVEQNPRKYLMLDQFSNPANPRIHEETTGPEIWADTGGKVDVLVSGVGTGGTITGVSRYLKKKRKSLVSVAVEPEESPVIGQKLRGQELKPGPHPIQGIGAGFIPETLDLGVLDRVETVSGPDAIAFARRLCREEGILSGISCGAAVAVCDRLSREKQFEGKTIVVILPDSGERYLSSVLFEGLV